ncbi:MAG TPA: MFS transporter, partial [Candidatus Udaeobacter sp.]|nr:MFS transporter [Candidatus Udaeobacter sp.]
DALAGLLYVVRQNTTLRGVALTLSTYNMAWGVLEIAVPVLVLTRLHQGAGTVGLLWGGLGAAGLVSALLSGRIRSQGRERSMMLGAILVGAAAMVALALANNLYVVAIALVVFGFSNGPFDIALFTLRQRVTDPAWFGRAFAVSMALNFVGTPVGSALAGPVIGWSLDGALWLAVGIAAVSAALPLLAIPRSEAPTPSAR